MTHVLDRAIVIKLGGSIYDSRDSVITDIIELQKRGEPLIIVHGGASLVTQWLARQNHETMFHEGERITDEASLEMVTAVLAGLVNKEIVATILNAGGRAVGISGVDGGLIQGKIRERARGYIGAVVRVNPAPLEALVSAGFIPVVAPVSFNAFEKNEGERALLNINGDTVAGAIAAELKVSRLVFLTDVDGLMDSRKRLLGRIDSSQAAELLKSGTASGGMIPKLKACIQAAGNHTTTCSIINGSRPHCLKNELTGGNTGTEITPDLE